MYTLNLTDVDKNTQKAGVKGAYLGELLKSGIPIPPGFIVTTDTYNAFLKENRFIEKISNIVNNLDFNNTNDLKEKSTQIENLILNGQITTNIKNEIQSLYEKLSFGDIEGIDERALDMIRTGRDNIPVAVRSSSDNCELKLRTYLNISGIEKILEAIKRCWSSLFTEKILSYRKEKNISNPSVAIIIQKMLNPTRSGVILTSNPKDKSQLIVKSTWGLGESISSGLVTPDLCVLDKSNGNIIDKKISEKAIQIVRDRFGNTIKQRVFDDRVLQDSLNAEICKKLWEFGVRAETHCGSSQDIRWCEERGRVFLLQSLPITEEAEKQDEIQKIPGSDNGSLITATEIKTNITYPSEVDCDGVGLLRSSFLLDSGKHPVYLAKNNPEELIETIENFVGGVAKTFYPKKVWYRSFDESVDELQNLDGDEDPEKNPLLGWHGIRRSLDDIEILKCEISALRKLYEKGLNNISIILPFVTNLEEIREVREIINFPIKIGIVVETPAASLNIEEFVNEIDFIAVDLKNLTQLTLGVDRENTNVSHLYSESHPAVLKLLKNVIDTCKNKIEICVCGNSMSPELIEKLIRYGVDSISIDPESLDKIKHLVARTERRMLLEKIKSQNIQGNSYI